MKSPEETLKSAAAAPAGRVCEFAGLRLDVARRVLQRGDEVLHLYPRAFDALVLLVTRRDEVVTKDELMDQLWPDVLVEENSLARLISDLRKGLGDASDRIVTVPKRGYRFDGVVKVEGGPVAARSTEDAEAHSLFHRGRYWLARRASPGAIVRAIECFREAIEKDPQFAAAHAALGEAHLASSIAAFGDTEPPLRAIPLARAAAERALQLDPALAGPHAVLGHIAVCFDWDWGRAHEAFEAAVRIDPRHVATRQSYAIGLMAVGDFDGALRELDLARELDPTSMLTRTNVGFVLARSGRLDEALLELERCIELEPALAYVRYRYGLALQEAGRLQEAEAQFGFMEATPGARIPMLAAQAHLAAATGDAARARSRSVELESLAANQYVSAWFFAEIAAGLGETDAAINWLGKAFEERSMLMIALDSNFKLDALRRDRRFAELRRRVGLWS